MRTYAYKFLAFLCSAIIAALLFLGWWLAAPAPLPEDRPLLAWSAGDGTAAPVLPADAAPADLDPVEARPLFAPTRRPFVAPAPEEPQVVEDVPLLEPDLPPEEPPEPVPEPPQVTDPASFRLKGIFVADGKRLGLIATPDNPNGQWQPAGSAVMGWKITEIQDDSVTLSHGEQVFALKQYVDNSDSPLGPPQLDE